ncbi:hypothetical protein TWF281_000136 [Arthrobotrys megalospora]
MSIEVLPTEILIQVLDDASLEVGDLAIISRVSRRWHSAVVPVLYKRFTFRYYHPLDKDDEKKLESFKKYGHHVKCLNLHIKRWSEDHDSLPVPDIDRYLEILESFTEVTSLEHYDIDIRGMGWPTFWEILHYIVCRKQKLISLTVRRNIHWGISPSSDQDVDPDTLLPAPRLPNLTYFNLRVNSRRSGPDTPESFPFFLNNLISALGDSCQSVSNLQLYVKIFETTDPAKLAALWGIGVPLLAIDSLKELRYEMLPGVIPPSHVIDTKFEDTKVLTAPGWVCGRWLNWAWEQVPPGESLDIFNNLETLRITDIFKKDENDDIEADLARVLKHLPKLRSLILEDDERRFSISRKLDGTPIWEEVPFVV